MSEIIVNSDKSKAEFMDEVDRLYDKNKYLRVTIKTGRQRTNKQNAALHKYLDMLSEVLNDSGYCVTKTLSHDAEIPWSAAMAKELLWKPLQLAVIEKESTAEAHRDEYIKVYDVLNRHLGEKLGVHVPWPSHETK